MMQGREEGTQEMSTPTIEAAWRDRATLAQPTLSNGLTEAETSATASVMGLTHDSEYVAELQARAQAPQAEVTDAEIVAVMRDGNNCNYNDEAEHIQFARAILALRPERVPMTDLPEGDVTYFDGRGDAVDGYTAERVWEILRSHGITAQAKKEGA